MITTNIKGTNFELAPDIRSYIEKRMRSFEKFVDKDDTSAVADVEIERSTHHQTGNVFRAEVTMHTCAGTVRAEENGTTPEEAFDKVKHEISRELRRGKNKQNDLMRRGGARIKEMARGIAFWRR